ncbi:gamma-glutamyltransferase [Nonomuraea sp. NPDC005650]|uniref:gamma-glutamyltransferase n=1 Tax=Nonomuraea sp. NPDC005650 TaxID=3157045 RepID=UPI0033A920B8
MVSRSISWSRQQVGRSAARGTGGAVAAPREESVVAGLGALDQGGNAVDAAVAAALVAGVVEPMETTLAGSGFMMVHAPDDGVWAVEFGPRAPAAAYPGMFRPLRPGEATAPLGVTAVADDANKVGPLACGVPRTLVGLLDAQRRFGRLTPAAVIEPAVQAAYDGFAADPWFTLTALAQLPALRKDAGSAAVFLRDGDLPLGACGFVFAGPSFGEPERVRQPALGATLELVAARGTSVLTDGPVAARLLETVARVGGLLSADDLRQAAPQFTRPLTIDFRGTQVHAPRAPGGGLTELQILAAWQALHPEAPPPPGSAEWVRDLALVIQHAFADRYHWLGDPDFVPVPESLLAPAYLGELVTAIRSGEPPARHCGTRQPWEVFASLALHDPWRGGGTAAPVWNPAGGSVPGSGTTHISVMDPDGWAVSVTHTAANPYGSAVLCPETGLLLDSAMVWFNAVPGAANSIRGGARPVANMGPVLVTAGGQLAAVGASGGRRIISAVSQLVLHLVEGGAGAEEAVNAPRLDGSGTELLIDDQLTDQGTGLAEYGLDVVPVSLQHQPFSMDFARANLVLNSPGGSLTAAIDPHPQGHAAALSNRIDSHDH